MEVVNIDLYYTSFEPTTHICAKLEQCFVISRQAHGHDICLLTWQKTHLLSTTVKNMNTFINLPTLTCYAWVSCLSIDRQQQSHFSLSISCAWTANSSLLQTACKFDSITKITPINNTTCWENCSWSFFQQKLVGYLLQSSEIFGRLVLDKYILKSSELLQTSLAMFGNDWHIIGKSK